MATPKLSANALTGIGYGANFLGGLITNYANYRMAENANAAQERMQDKANAFSFDMWNRENAYNHPLQQMKRLQEAGINPALAYSNGISNTAGAAPNSVQPNEVHRARFDNPMLEFQNLATDVAKAKLLDEESKLTSANTQKTMKDIWLSDKIGLRIDNEIKLSNAQIDEIRARMDKIYSEIRLITSQVNNLDQNTFYTWSKQQAQDFENAFNKAVAGIRFQKEGYEANYVKAMTLKIASDIALNESNIRLNNSQISINGQVFRGLNIDNNIKEATFDDVVSSVSAESKNNRLTLQVNEAKADLRHKKDSEGNIIGTNWYGYVHEALDCVGKIFHGNVSFLGTIPNNGSKPRAIGFKFK